MELQSLLAYCPVLLDLEAYKMSGVKGKMVKATRVFSSYGSPDGTPAMAGYCPLLLDLEAYKMSGVVGKMVQATRIFSTYESPDGTTVSAGILPSTTGS